MSDTPIGLSQRLRDEANNGDHPHSTSNLLFEAAEVLEAQEKAVELFNSVINLLEIKDAAIRHDRQERI